jgi:aryl-alcohol dehydrogenase-like predicted oxidoreductase
MEYGSIPGIDKSVSRIVQGTVMLDEADPSTAFALLDAAVEAGCTAFDTARHYGRGSEAVFGRWLRDRGLRDRIMVQGMGAHHSAERRRVTPEDIEADLNQSLRQFGFDHIDLYLLHRDDPNVPVGPIVAALDGHRRVGKIRAYGGSNWSNERIAEANAYADANGHQRFAASSPNFSLAAWVQPPWAECVSISGPDGEAARAWYAAEGMPVIPWSSLAGGFFSGRFRRDNVAGFTEYLDRTCIDAYASEDNFKRLDRAEELAKERGLTIPQIALAYVLNNPVNVFALVGCRTPREFAENAAAVATRLTPAEVAWLELKRDDRA